MLLRAGAELVVIVVGILLALAFDGWAQQRADRELETEYLARLVQDLVADSTELVGLLGHFTFRQEMTALLRGALAHPSAYEGDLDALLGSVVVATLDPGEFSPSTATLREMEGTGNLTLLRAPRLRGVLMRTAEILNERSASLAEDWRSLDMRDFSLAIDDADWDATLAGDHASGSLAPTLSSLRNVPGWEAQLRNANRTSRNAMGILRRLEARVVYTMCELRRVQSLGVGECRDDSGL